MTTAPHRDRQTPSTFENPTSTQAVMVYLTTPDRETAEAIARDLIDQRLAACANLIEDMTSIFFWEGEVRHDRECIVILKTQYRVMSDLVAAVKALHPYECPCIVSVPIVGGAADFIHWIKTQTSI
ncbi:divalent-cation tolerance protein CutA [Varunaivibrio sulfuroxidans]|uniref:Periplasmic divalent cation tolerance protein n=1 Tax=Varunaivibrio sulfuroxidans TaxID=1773489 RepID=A0A4R3J5Q9_9PROT|nr:divalent-cation tolerance protein CutA [Varunaivibrio sulfuroxidans]TCS61229.1 periplasmic divalent cation tolerance protein [Varunaivibrio sulfuroxidans]WES31150.1 divalent-cation tolerance protein CutA [Varunaivibrio sulfuroxidans]